MAKDEKKTITINDVQYNIDELSNAQIAMVNHIADLDRKLANARFNVDQLQVGRDAFLGLLTASLAEENEEPSLPN